MLQKEEDIISPTRSHTQTHSNARTQLHTEIHTHKRTHTVKHTHTIKYTHNQILTYAASLPTVDISRLEVAQLHLRHLVGGRARSFTGHVPDEKIYQVCVCVHECVKVAQLHLRHLVGGRARSFTGHVHVCQQVTRRENIPGVCARECVNMCVFACARVCYCVCA